VLCAHDARSLHSSCEVAQRGPALQGVGISRPASALHRARGGRDDSDSVVADVAHGGGVRSRARAHRHPGVLPLAEGGRESSTAACLFDVHDGLTTRPGVAAYFRRNARMNRMDTALRRALPLLMT